LFFIVFSLVREEVICGYNYISKVIYCLKTKNIAGIESQKTMICCEGYHPLPKNSQEEDVVWIKRKIPFCLCGKRFYGPTIYFVGPFYILKL
jgi:hypothetical protein